MRRISAFLTALCATLLSAFTLPPAYLHSFPSGGPIEVVSRATTGCTTGNPAIINLPSTVSAGQVLVAPLYVKGNGVSITTLQSGWTTIFTQQGSNGDGFLALFSRVADGTEGGTTLSVTTNTAGQTYQAQSLAISNAHGASSSDIEYATNVPGAVANPDPPSLTPTWGTLETLWITGTGYQDDDETVAAWPTGYDTNGVDLACGLGDNLSANLALSYRIATSASEDPSAFTLSFTELTTAFTVGVRPQ